MALKTRYQNPVIDDTVKLQLFAYNSNNYANFAAVNMVEIYYLDRNARTQANPEGRVLVETIMPASVINPQTGEYYIDLF